MIHWVVRQPVALQLVHRHHLYLTPTQTQQILLIHSLFAPASRIPLFPGTTAQLAKAATDQGSFSDLRTSRNWLVVGVGTNKLMTGVNLNSSLLWEVDFHNSDVRIVSLLHDKVHAKDVRVFSVCHSPHMEISPKPNLQLCDSLDVSSCHTELCSDVVLS